MKINEIFLSIQGEGQQQGEPTTFIRLYGCNNNCAYCDTKYAVCGDEYEEMSVIEIIEKVKKLGCNNLCITGGEPLTQTKELMELCARFFVAGKYEIWIETNGTLPVFKIDNAEFTNKLHYVVDIKCPSSKMQNKTDWHIFKALDFHDEVKFVVATQEDYDFMKLAVGNLKNYCKAKLLVSPAFTSDKFKPTLEPSDLVEQLLEDKLDVRVSVQIHKIIWDPSKRAV